MTKKSKRPGMSKMSAQENQQKQIAEKVAAIRVQLDGINADAKTA